MSRMHLVITARALPWLIGSQFALLLPHLSRLPVWVPGLYIAAALWRVLQQRGRVPVLPLVTRSLLALGSFVGIYFSYGTLLGLEATVALLLCACALKTLELQYNKDGYLLIFLSYFVCVTIFLFDQSIPVTVYLVPVVWLITTALIALQGRSPASAGDAPRRAAVLLGQAVPLMLVLFIIFPRLPPLWSVPYQQNAAQTGVSETMRPGDIAQLSRSDKVALRAQFEGVPPERRDLYWRALVLTTVEDGTWRSLDYTETPPNEWRPRVAEELLGDPATALRYSVMMMPTQQRWLYALHYATSPERSIMAAGDFRLFSPMEIRDEIQYRVVSWPQARTQVELSDWRRSVSLALPVGENPRTLALGDELRQRYARPADRVDAALRLFNQQPFVYTLNPPLLGNDPMDTFLFDTRRGFCEHYAAAFVTLMRAADVPARVVTGYQGGEVNPISGSVVVRQFDAHAWAEVWYEGEGWTRIDPTAAVAPERIEMGLEDALAAEGSFLADLPLSPLRYRHIVWVNQMRLRYDAMTDQWQRWVISYSSSSQEGLLQRLLGQISALRVTLLVLGVGLLVLLPVSWLLLRKPGQARDPALRTFEATRRELTRRQLPLQAGEAPLSYLRRAALHFSTAAVPLTTLAHLLEGTLYRAGGGTVQTDALRTAARQVRQHLRRLPPPPPASTPPRQDR